jgi:hypothetical protein
LRSWHIFPISGLRKGDAMNCAPASIYLSVMVASSTVPAPRIISGKL